MSETCLWQDSLYRFITWYIPPLVWNCRPWSIIIVYPGQSLYIGRYVDWLWLGIRGLIFYMRCRCHIINEDYIWQFITVLIRSGVEIKSWLLFLEEVVFKVTYIYATTNMIFSGVNSLGNSNNWYGNIHMCTHLRTFLLNESGAPEYARYSREHDDKWGNHWWNPQPV